jgi:hypothetical protein
MRGLDHRERRAMAELDVVITRLDQFDKRMDERFEAMNTRIDDLTHRMGDVISRLNTVEGRLTSIDTRLDGKASQGLIQFWGGFVTAWTSILVGTVVAVLKLWP